MEYFLFDLEPRGVEVSTLKDNEGRTPAEFAEADKRGRFWVHRAVTQRRSTRNLGPERPEAADDADVEKGTSLRGGGSRGAGVGGVCLQGVNSDTLRCEKPTSATSWSLLVALVSGWLATFSSGVLMVLFWLAGDMTGLVVAALAFVMAVAAFRFMCLVRSTSPGTLTAADMKQRRSEYDSILKSDSLRSGEGFSEAICHQLRVKRPPRAKYCPMERGIVPVYDHYCGFLYKTIGRDNYKFFFGTLACTLASCMLLVAALSLALGESIGVEGLDIALIVYFGLFVLNWSALTAFHVYLCSNNLTTDEAYRIQYIQKPYSYMINSDGLYSNPFDTGSTCGNFSARLFPDFNAEDGATPERARLLAS